MHKLAYLIFLILFLFSAHTARSEPAVAKELPTIKLGVTVPLTGDFASYGQLIREGVELAHQDLAKSGHKLEIVYEDACLPAGAVSAIKKLVAVDQIHALVANFCVIAMPPMADTIEKAKIIAFHTASASDSILNAGDFIFTTNIKVQNEARKLAEYAYRDLHAKTASILYITTDFGQDYNKHFTERFTEFGGKILTSDTNPPGSNDFRSELTRVKAVMPDVLFAAHLGPSLGILVKQAREIGLSQQVLGVYEAEDPSVLETARAAAEGLRFFVPEPLTESPKLKNFQERFRAAYGHAPRILASNAYDATMIAVETLDKCKLNEECAKKEIYAIRDYPGASGVFSIEPDGGTHKDFVPKTVHNGKFERIEAGN